MAMQYKMYCMAILIQNMTFFAVETCLTQEKWMDAPLRPFHRRKRTVELLNLKAKVSGIRIPSYPGTPAKEHRGASNETVKKHQMPDRRSRQIKKHPARAEPNQIVQTAQKKPRV